MSLLQTSLKMDLQDKTKEELIKELLELTQKYDSLKSSVETGLLERKHSEHLHQQSQNDLFGTLRDVNGHKISDSLFSDIIEKNPMSIQILNMEGYVIQVNPAHTKLFGIHPPADYSIFKDTKLLQQGFGELFERIKKGEIVQFPDSYFNIKDVNPSFPDSPVWVKAIGFILNNSDGLPDRIVIMHENITGRRLAESILNDIIDKNPMSIQIVDKDGFTIRGNPAYIKLFGVLPPADFSIFDDLESKSPEIKKLILRAKNGEVVHLPDIYFNAHDVVPEAPDNPLWIRALLFPLKESGDKQGRFVFMHENITERKLAEHTIKESELKYRTVFATEKDALFLVDNETFSILEVNDAACQLCGYSEEEMLKLKTFELSAEPELSKKIQKEFKERIENRKHKKKNGTIFTADISANRFTLNGSTFMLAAIRDITERKMEEEALKLSEEKWRTLFEILPIGVSIRDKDGNIRESNPELKRILDLSDSDLKNGKYQQRIYLNSDQKQISKHEFPSYRAINDQEVIRNVEIGIVKEDGTKIWTKVSAAPFFNHSNCVLVTSDITQGKHLEEILKNQSNELKILNADKDRFISILGHDLRSPFNAILGLLDLLSENIREYDLDRIEEFITIINHSAHNTFELLEDILLWIRAHSGNITFEPQNLNFGTICNEVIDNLKQTANRKHITINHFTGDELTVFADKNMLKTVLRNLISNAIKFTKNNGQVDISVKQDQPDLVISICDNGIGIEPDILNSLFEISQISTTKGTANEKGTGLGLILCKDFVEKHGGKIWAESEGGKGSIFSFTIPRGAEPEKEIVLKTGVSQKNETTLIKKLKILVAEDEAESDMFIQAVIKYLVRRSLLQKQVLKLLKYAGTILILI